MSKIDLKICVGTMCYVMGGAELRGIAEAIPDDIRELVDISFSPCLGRCSHAGEPPYIELNGRVIARVSKSNLIQMIKEELENAVR